VWQIHEDAMKCIVQYLKGAKDEGLFLKPTGTFQFDCYVDADFAALFWYEDDQEPVCVRPKLATS